MTAAPAARIATMMIPANNPELELSSTAVGVSSSWISTESSVESLAFSSTAFEVVSSLISTSSASSASASSSADSVVFAPAAFVEADFLGATEAVALFLPA